MTYPEILAAVLGVLGVPLAAGSAFVVWDGRRDDPGTSRRPRPPGGRGTWARRRAHWVARCQAQAILGTAHARAWGIRATAAVRVQCLRARGKGWQWRARARRLRSVWADRNAGRFDSALGSPVTGHAPAGAAGLPTLAAREPTRLATPGERSDAGLPARDPS